MVSVIKKILKIIVDVLIFLVFGMLALIIVAKVNMIINNINYFRIFDYSVFVVATGSMEPALSQNDIVFVKKEDNLREADIITFEKDGNFITHRIVSINVDNIITKGDANNTNDYSIKKEDVIGKVVKVFKNAGIWQKILTTPSIIIMIFVTLILFDFAFSYKGFKKEPKVDKVDNEKDKEENSSEITKEKETILDKDKLKTLDYTIGINLEEIQNEINRKMEEDKE